MSSNTIKNLLEIRNKLKEKKPDFIRQDNQRRKRLGRKLKWRKPKGIHSKIRHHFKGRRKMPSPGYKSPVKVKGYHSSGLKMTKIFSVKDIEKINKDTEGIIISKSVGTKKKLEILKKAKELKINVLNLNIDEHINKIELMINSKKSKDKGIQKKKAKEAKESKEEKIKEPTEAGPISNEKQKEEEKKEKDKVLTKRA